MTVISNQVECSYNLEMHGWTAEGGKPQVPILADGVPQP